ncbi:uncharacterized protein LOC108918300 [Scleropages formosus]|uniref:uncharacterized protein LOC108918300 n=1 Tax=Scleropages formosus TaxID=113540 RepID=UPI0010FA7840|nr:uncharacterized protein LOC108918300 [Scleropages formosus]
MMRILTALLVLHFSSSEEVLVESAVTMAVKIGDTVILHCSHKHSEETLWLGQRCDEVPFIIICAGCGYRDKYFRGFNGQFSTVKNSRNGSIGLRIRNVSDSDLGLFYCTTKFGVPMLVGSGYKLYRAEGPASPTSSPPDYVTTRPASPGSSACLGLSHIWALALCPLCALLAALISASCVCWVCRRKGEYFHSWHSSIVCIH